MILRYLLNDNQEMADRAEQYLEAGEVFVVKLAKPLPLRQVVMAIRSEERLTSAALLFTKFAARLAKDREAKAH